MTTLRLLSSSALMLLAVAGCQHPEASPPPLSSHAPPTLTSSPVPPPEHPGMHGASGPHGGPGGGPGGHFHGGDEVTRVYRYDFVLTSKDPKDASLVPTSFTMNMAENQNGEVMIGRNVPLQVTSGTPIPGSKEPPTPHVSPRQDVGIKVKAHARGIAGSEDLLLDVELEMSAVEAGTSNASSIRKVTTRGNAVATPGKSALVVSLDDDKRHFELTVTPTKLR